MADTPDILACNYGTAALDLESYSVDEQPILNPQTNLRTGTRVVITANCLLRSDSQANLASGLLQAVNDLRQNGRDLVITGLNGGAEYQLPAAICQFDGPFVNFTINDGDAPLTKKVSMRVEAQTLPPLSLNIPVDSFSVAVSRRPDDLLIVTRRGTVNGVNTPGYLLGTIYPAFRANYPLPNWVTSIDFDASQDGNQSKLTYSMVARQNFGPLPSGSGALAVDGDASVRIERDEQMRKTTTYDFDLLVVGDPFQLINQIRPRAAVILREQWHVTQVKENRLQCTFTVLQSADVFHDRLVSFTQTARVLPQAEIWEEKTYIGADPILVLRPKTFPRLQQSGTATALDAFFAAPDPMFPSLAEQPDLSYEESGTPEKRTQWSYEAYALDGDGNLAPPASLPDFIRLQRDQQPDAYAWEKPEAIS